MIKQPGILLPPAYYKAEFAKNNAEFNQQLELDFTKEKLDIVCPKKYALLTYGYNLGMLTHLNIVFPDSTYKMSMYEPINLLKDVHIYNGYVSKEEEERIVALKKSLREEKSIK